MPPHPPAASRLPLPAGLLLLLAAGTPAQAQRAPDGEASTVTLEELDVAGQILPDWAVIAGYGFTQAEVTQDPLLVGKQLLNTPRVSASAFLTHQFGAIADAAEFGATRLGAGFLEAGFGARYVGARPGDAANSFSLPEYVVCDAFLAYNTEVNGLPTTLQLNLKNLFNEACYPSSGGSNLLVAVGEPFQALVTARVAW